MIWLAPFAPADVIGLELQPWQQVDAPALTLEHGRALASGGGVAWTARDGARILGCAGVGEIDRGYGVAWALFGKELGRGMVAVTRRARETIAGGSWHRVEAVVRADWPCALRWAHMLGLEERCRLRKWGALAMDHLLFDWVAP